MANEAKTHGKADLLKDGEKRYTDPYALYRRLSDALENSSDGETLDPEEIRELWRRWLEAMLGMQGENTNTKNDFIEGISSVWEEMARELRDEMLSERSPPEDPVRFFVRWYRDNGERWSGTADELLRKEEFLEQASRFLETYARYHKQFRHLSEEGLKALHIPTGSDIARVAKLILVVENKVDRIEEAFEEFIYSDSEPAAAGDVEDLRERMDRLENKMDQILAAVEKLGASGAGKAPTEANGRGMFVAYTEKEEEA